MGRLGSLLDFLETQSWMLRDEPDSCEPTSLLSVEIVYYFLQAVQHLFLCSVLL